MKTNRQAIGSLPGEYSESNALAEMTAAAHLLHEQAHGDVPWRTCQADPCRSIDGSRTRGPAQRTLIAGVL